MQKRININKIVEEFGTPLYIYEAEKIRSNYLELQDCFGQLANIFYSLKANPNVSIAALLRQVGAGAEVSSMAELETALIAGFTPENIIAVGPYKSINLLQRCLELDIYAIVCESKQELLAVAEIAKSTNRVANVALRINPKFSAEKAPLKMGGVPSQFGIDEDQINFIEFSKIPSIQIVGIHIYNGSRILDTETIYSNVQNIFNLADHLFDQSQNEFSMLDVGGGFGVPYYVGEKSINLTELKSKLIPLINKFKNSNQKIRIIVESGRFLVANAGIFVTQVKVIKESHGQNFAITDGGTNCHMTAVGVGSVLKRNFSIETLPDRNNSKLLNYHLAGPLCTPGDLIAKNIQLPELGVGDLIMVNNSGAYGPSASPTYFLGHGYPAEILIQDGKPHLIRNSDSYQDILKKQILL